MNKTLLTCQSILTWQTFSKLLIGQFNTVNFLFTLVVSTFQKKEYFKSNRCVTKMPLFSIRIHKILMLCFMQTCTCIVIAFVPVYNVNLIFFNLHCYIQTVFPNLEVMNAKFSSPAQIYQCSLNICMNLYLITIECVDAIAFGQYP